MYKMIVARVLQGHRTIKFPDRPPPSLPERFRGQPVIDTSLCPAECSVCADICPTQAINPVGSKSIDLGKCLFCMDCHDACPQKAITFSQDYRLAVRNREDLLVDQDNQIFKLASELEKKVKRIFGRSLKLRQISAGGCNGCESDINVLGTIGWDLGRFGIQFVASPRHADGLVITGPITQNMVLALKKTYEAIPEPKLVIAIGACAISGGPFIDLSQVNNGAGSFMKIDLFIPGCPPHPLTILDGLLRLIGRIKKP